MTIESADPTGDLDGPPLTGDSAEREFKPSDSHGATSHSPGMAPETRDAPPLEADPQSETAATEAQPRSQTPDHNKFRIVNNHSKKISVVIMYYSPQSCRGAGGGWATEGWWNIPPGGSAVVYKGTMRIHRKWYYHAYASDGTLWEGSIHAAIPNAAFTSCYGNGSGTTRGFREIDIGNFASYTLTLN